MRSLPVYLIHWDAPQWCLSASRSVLQSVGLALSLTIVNNGPTVSAKYWAVNAVNARVINLATNRGFSGGANAALDDWMNAPSPAPYCVIGSHDLHVTPSTLASLVDCAAKNTAYGVIAPGLTAPCKAFGGSWANGLASTLGSY